MPGRRVALAAVVLMLGPAVAAGPSAMRDPVAYTAQTPDGAGRTQLVLLAADGMAIGLHGTIVRGGPNGGGPDMKQGYWLYCGQWRRTPGGLSVSDRLAESFRYRPPPDALSQRRRVYRMDGAEENHWPLRITDAGQQYVLAGHSPIGKATLERLRFTCAKADDRSRSAR